MRVAGDHQFSDIAAGSSFTCDNRHGGVRRSDGEGTAGQLGAGAFFDFAYEPQSIAGGNRFISVVAGKAHACGIDDLRPRGAGANSYGNSVTAPSTTSVAVRVAGDHVFKQLGAGAESIRPAASQPMVPPSLGFQRSRSADAWSRKSQQRAREGPRLSRLRSIDPERTRRARSTTGECMLGKQRFWAARARLARQGHVLPTPRAACEHRREVRVTLRRRRSRLRQSRTGATYCWVRRTAAARVKPEDTCTDRQISCARSPSVVSDASLTQRRARPQRPLCVAGRTRRPLPCIAGDAISRSRRSSSSGEKPSRFADASARKQNGR